MACTTILVGKKASYDGSTIMARNDDSPSGIFTPKKIEFYPRKQGKETYRSVISHVEIELPEESFAYTATPNIDMHEGLWLASGINEFNVSVTATETLTTNARVMGADPYVKYQKAEEGKEEVKGGIGEEDIVRLVLPYIKSAREGVLRLGSLLETYGTYEPNGIGFADHDEVWWLETIGGHHWIAKRVEDDQYVVMPNQFGIDSFDFEDAFSKGEKHLCSKDLREFIEEYHLDLTMDGLFNPRLAFGSHDDSDHVYNTPRAWYVIKTLNPSYLKEHELTPLSDNLPWSLRPERKLTIEEVKYLLASHYQGTEYDPYARFGKVEMKGAYRPIGISRTSDMSILQVRPSEEAFCSIQWINFGCNCFNASAPLYTNCTRVPEYYKNTTDKVSTDNFYWSMRLLGALVDSHFNICEMLIERYQSKVSNRSHEMINRFDRLIKEGKLIQDEANDALAAMVKEETDDVLNKVLYQVSCHMKNGYSRSDN